MLPALGLKLIMNWKKIAVGGGLAALAIAAFLFKNHYDGIIADRKHQAEQIENLELDVRLAVQTNGELSSEVDRLNVEARRTIKIVEIAAITRTETLETSEIITKDLPDEEPMCGPWSQYFSNVVQHTSREAETNGDQGGAGEGSLPGP